MGAFLQRIGDALAAWPPAVRWGLGGLLAVAVLIGLFTLAFRVGRRSPGRLLAGFTALAVLTGLVFGIWAFKLPELKGPAFVPWHQAVRLGAVLGGVGTVLGALGLALPRVLDRVEGSGFVSMMAARHVRADKSGFLTAISILSIAGVGMSCFCMCGVVSMMGGFGADLKRKILDNNAHVRIEGSSAGGFAGYEDMLVAIRTTRGVKAATAVAGGEAMASSASNTAGVQVRGVDTLTLPTVIDILPAVEVGEFAWLDDAARLADLPPETPIGIGADGRPFLKGPDFRSFALSDSLKDVSDALRRDDVYPGVAVGRELAKTLHVFVGDEITLISPMGDLGPMGILPRSRKFRVAAIFYTGMYEYDATQVYMKIDAAQEFLDLGGHVTSLAVRVEDPEAVEAVRAALGPLVAPDGLRVLDWKELNKKLLSALKLEKVLSFIVLGIAIVVASFCISCTLLLMVTEKSKEIAILKAQGASDGAVLRIFILEGVIIGAIGTTFGVSLGLALTLGLKWFGVRLDPDVYYVDRLPIFVDPAEYAFIAVAALIITTLSTVYPALAASRLRPVDGIRWE